MSIVDFTRLTEGFRAEDLAQRKANILDNWAIACAKSGKDINEYLKQFED